MKQLFLLFAIIFAVVFSFSACQRIEQMPSSSESDLFKEPDSPAEAQTFSSATEASLPESSEPSVPAEITDITTAEEPVPQESLPDEEQEEPEDPEEPITLLFSFPEEFYTRLEEIFEAYSINRLCEPDLELCGCYPEYEVLDEKGNVVEPRDRVMSIYYCDIESGFELSINPQPHYPVASTVKIPFCICVYEKLSRGELDPETVLVYEKRHYFGGTGVIVKGDYGQQFTVLQLLELAITESDNVAYEMLKDVLPWEEFEEYLASIGCTHSKDTRKRQQKICNESAGCYGRLLAEFLSGDNPYKDVFQSHLKLTKNRMIRSHYPFNRKYGWTNFAFHDIAYVEAPHPYVISILSNLDGVEKADYNLFTEVSYLIEEYAVNSERIYATPEMLEEILRSQQEEEDVSEEIEI